MARELDIKKIFSVQVYREGEDLFGGKILKPMHSKRVYEGDARWEFAGVNYAGANYAKGFARKYIKLSEEELERAFVMRVEMYEEEGKEDRFFFFKENRVLYYEKDACKLLDELGFVQKIIP